MIRIRVLGRVDVERSDGAVGPAGQQRKPLALLVLLGMARRRGITRDELLGYLWPNADEEGGRRSLKQTVYALRRDLGSEDLILSTESEQRLSLNAGVAALDVWEFETAVAANQLELATQLYQGSFLDGFSLRAGAEFDHWIDRERARLVNMYASTLERLATKAEATGDAARACDWWRRLVNVKPLDSRVAIRLIECLAATGDRSAALLHARSHQAALRDELDAAPDPTIATLEDRLRSGDTPFGSQRLRANHRLSSAESPTPPASVETTSSRAPRRRRRMVVAGVVGVFALATAVIAMSLRGIHRPALAMEGARLAILPFRVASADTSLQYLSEGVVDLLVAKVAGSALTPISAARSVASWRSLTADRSASPAQVAQSAAERLRATRVVTGAVLISGSRVTLQAELFDASRRRILALAPAEGGLEDLPRLLDRVAAEILGVAAGGGAERTPSLAATPLDAVRAYAEGRQAFRAADYRRAAASFQRAVKVDSTFSLAALDLVRVSGWLGDDSTRHAARTLAWAHRDRLSPADLALLTAIVGPAFPRSSTGRERVEAWERATQLMADDPDPWFELGDQLFHGADILGDGTELSRAAAAFNAALELDPAYGPALEHALQLAATIGDTATMLALGDRAIAGQATTGQADFLRWRLAMAMPARDDNGAARRARFDAFDARSLTSIALAGLFDQVGIEDADSALRSMERRSPRAGSQTDAMLGLHAVALARGRRREAARTLARIASTNRARDASYLTILDAIYAGASVQRADATANALAEPAILYPSRLGAVDQADSAQSAAVGSASACVLGQWWYSRGQLDAARNALAALTQWRGILAAIDGSSSSALADATLCVTLLSVSLDATTRGNDDRSISRLDFEFSQLPNITSRFESQLPLAISALWERAGKPREALRAIRRTGYFFRWPHYRAQELCAEARLSAAVGDTVGAVTAYARYLALHSAADVELEPEVAAARAEMRKLQSMMRR